MKNQYVGDINDYFKYSLIEIISEVLSEKVLVAWMLTGNDDRNDGNKLNYLKNEKNERQFNPELFDKLKSIDQSNRRIEDVQKNLSDKYKFHSETLVDCKEKRKKYFQSLSVKAREADWVFFDPDTRIEVISVKQGNKNSSQYLFWNEIEQIAKMKKDLLIYQHFPRGEKHEVFIKRITEQLREKTEMEVLPIKTVNVLFLLATEQKDKLNEIKRKLEEMPPVCFTSKQINRMVFQCY
jgi:hypothetical protein